MSSPGCYSGSAWIERDRPDYGDVTNCLSPCCENNPLVFVPILNTSCVPLRPNRLVVRLLFVSIAYETIRTLPSVREAAEMLIVVPYVDSVVIQKHEV